VDREGLLSFDDWANFFFYLVLLSTVSSSFRMIGSDVASETQEERLMRHHYVVGLSHNYLRWPTPVRGYTELDLSFMARVLRWFWLCAIWALQQGTLAFNNKALPYASEAVYRFTLYICRLPDSRLPRGALAYWSPRSVCDHYFFTLAIAVCIY